MKKALSEHLFVGGASAKTNPLKKTPFIGMDSDIYRYCAFQDPELGPSVFYDLGTAVGVGECVGADYSETFECTFEINDNSPFTASNFRAKPGTQTNTYYPIFLGMIYYPKDYEYVIFTSSSVTHTETITISE